MKFLYINYKCYYFLIDSISEERANVIFNPIQIKLQSLNEAREFMF